MVQDFPENTGYTGSVHKGKKVPFKDGFTAVAKSSAPAKGSPAEALAQEAEAAEKSESGVENLIAHNFTGDATEPEHWKDPATGEKPPLGWKGDIHTRERDG